MLFPYEEVGPSHKGQAFILLELIKGFRPFVKKNKELAGSYILLKTGGHLRSDEHPTELAKRYEELCAPTK